jgi:hypothetical protein
MWLTIDAARELRTAIGLAIAAAEGLAKEGVE